MDFLLGVVRCYGGLPVLFVFSLVVFFHELGHFLVARLCGVRVLVFSIGFGPELFGFNDRHGTRWKVAAIPLGGYVKFFGDENAASVPDQAAVAAMTEAERSQSFVHKGVAARAAVVVAGPLANFLLAITIFAGLFMLYGKPSTAARVESVAADSAAAAAGFQPGDIVVSINGRRIESFPEMQRIVSMSAGQTLDIVVDRGGKQVTLTAVPALKEVKDSFGNVHRIGVLGISRSMDPNELQYEPVAPHRAIGLAVYETWFVAERTLSYIGRVFAGRESADQVGGPIRIAEVSCQVATYGMAALMQLAAVLSISIGLLNLFPVPLLDGGHLMFYAIEAIRGRPLSERAQEVGFRIGLALVLMLMIFATYNDISGIVRRFVS
ncbi:MAG: regulator of sigma protease [Alphaproteobacteria bacterium]|jgi:regulator of sigma E protease|nr:regulator of sigma protease [Alphaproteobacteria bacterium]MEA2988141.1 regulator of sigma protease [Alphaproteobacteria bacterium]